VPTTIIYYTTNHIKSFQLLCSHHKFNVNLTQSSTFPLQISYSKSQSFHTKFDRVWCINLTLCCGLCKVAGLLVTREKKNIITSHDKMKTIIGDVMWCDEIIAAVRPHGFILSLLSEWKLWRCGSTPFPYIATNQRNQWNCSTALEFNALLTLSRKQSPSKLSILFMVLLTLAQVFFWRKK